MASVIIRSMASPAGCSPACRPVAATGEGKFGHGAVRGERLRKSNRSEARRRASILPAPSSRGPPSGSRTRLRRKEPGLALAAASATVTHQGLVGLLREGAVWVYPALGWALAGASWASLVVYHYRLFNQHRHGHERRGTLSGPNIEARRRWAQLYAKNKKDVITAVQSLRNALMIAITNTSTSVALISVCLGPLLEAYVKGTFPILKELLYFPFPVLLDVLKFAILFGLLVAQFICFAQCCNYWVHMTFMLPVVEPEDAQLVTAEGLADIAIHAQLFWWWGYRCLYLTIPAVVWVVTGTIPFAVVSLVMLTVLTYLDRPLKKIDPLEYNL